MACFKAYDIRGRMPDDLNEDIAYRIGAAFAGELSPKRVVVGYDVRLSSPSLASALIRGLNEQGVDVDDIGLCGTEEVYFATADRNACGGIMVTASHNPIDYNGMKLVGENAKPISGDTGLKAIEHKVASGERIEPCHKPGKRHSVEARATFVEHLLGWVDATVLRPLKLVVNPGNSAAGQVLDALEPHLPFELIKMHYQPDGHFPNGIPNPLLPENRAATAEKVVASGADMGIAWDGDFDRCFFFDEQGRFVEGYYMVGLLAKALLKKWPGERIIHDPRLTWATIDAVRSAGGVPVQSKTGHAFIKERMREENALYGGEMSAHHYFRDFAYCDSGMIPWLLLAELVSRIRQPLGDLVAEAICQYPSSGEINRTVDDADQCLSEIEATYANQGGEIDRTDGLGVAFEHWRFNVRKSNTEPLLRLNVEARNDHALMTQRTQDLLAIIDRNTAQKESA